MTNTTHPTTDLTRCQDAITTITPQPHWTLTTKPNGTIIATDPHNTPWRIAPWPHNLWTTHDEPFGQNGALVVHTTPNDAYQATITRSNQHHNRKHRTTRTTP